MKATPMKWNPFRMRNIAGVALGLGILAGIWLGDIFKGFGLGAGKGAGQGPGTGQPAHISSGRPNSRDDDEADLVGHHAGEDDEAIAMAKPPKTAGLVKVLIDERSYFLHQDEKKTPISLEALVDKILQTEPNEDGLRAVIERTSSSRVSAELRLFDALKDAGVPTNSVYLAPHAVD